MAAPVPWYRQLQNASYITSAVYVEESYPNQSSLTLLPLLLEELIYCRLRYIKSRQVPKAGELELRGTLGIFLGFLQAVFFYFRKAAERTSVLVRKLGVIQPAQGDVPRKAVKHASQTKICSEGN